MLSNTLISHNKQHRLSIISIMDRRVNDAPAAWLGEAIDPTRPRLAMRGRPHRPGAKSGAQVGTGI